jgi:hypothetical protein
MLVKNDPISVRLFEDECIARDPDIRLTHGKNIEVIVPRLDSNVREDLDGVIVIEGDGITPLHKWDEVDVNCFSPIERLLIPSRRKQSSVLIIKLREPIGRRGS